MVARVSSPIKLTAFSVVQPTRMLSKLDKHHEAWYVQSRDGSGLQCRGRDEIPGGWLSSGRRETHVYNGGREEVDEEKDGRKRKKITKKEWKARPYQSPRRRP